MSTFGMTSPTDLTDRRTLNLVPPGTKLHSPGHRPGSDGPARTLPMPSPPSPLSRGRERGDLKILVLLALLLSFGCAQPAEEGSESTEAALAAPEVAPPGPFHQLALDVAAGLEAGAVEVEGAAPMWADDANNPERIGTSLGSGVGGKVLFFLALHEATGDAAHLDAARRGADHLLATLPEAVNAEAFPPAAGLFYGVAGTGMVLDRAHEATGDARYREGADRVLAMVSGATLEGDEILWHPSFNDLLFGNAGALLYLVDAAEGLPADDPRRAETLDLATRVGQSLLARGFEDQGGLNWKFRQDTDFVLPNFSHGAAGIGFVLARLHQLTGEAEFLDGALGAGSYLRAIADTADGGFRVPYGWPEPSWDGLHDVGWAHGPAGTARLFELLHQITGEASWRELVLACGQSALTSGMPGTPAAGYGDGPFPLDRRFGIAGVADFMLDLYRLSGDAQHLDYARQLTQHVRDQAVAEESGLVWEVPKAEGETPVRPTGLLSGAAGHGLLFLRLDAVERGLDTGIEDGLGLPDDPFASSEETTDA